MRARDRPIRQPFAVRAEREVRHYVVALAFHAIEADALHPAADGIGHVPGVRAKHGPVLVGHDRRPGQDGLVASHDLDGPRDRAGGDRISSRSAPHEKQEAGIVKWPTASALLTNGTSAGSSAPRARATPSCSQVLKRGWVHSLPELATRGNRPAGLDPFSGFSPSPFFTPVSRQSSPGSCTR